MVQSGVGQTRVGLRGWILEVQDQAGERVLSLGHNCVAASLTAFLWTEDLRVPEIPGERQGLFGEGSARDPRSVSLSPNENSNRGIHVGKGGAKGRAMLSHWLPPRQLPSLTDS